MIVKLLTEHHLEFLRLKEGCTGSSESTHVKMPQCWKSHALAQLCDLEWGLVPVYLSFRVKQENNAVKIRRSRQIAIFYIKNTIYKISIDFIQLCSQKQGTLSQN